MTRLTPQEMVDSFNLFKTSLEKTIVDPELSLEERWEYYKVAGFLLPVDGCYHHPEAEGLNWNKMSLYDDFCCDKYQTIRGTDFVDLCIDRNYDTYDTKPKEQINIDEVKEYFLQKGIYGFINDW